MTNRWTVTDLPGQMLGLQLAAPVWTGHDVVLAGTSGSATKSRLAVAAYNVADRRWQMITPRLPRGHPTGARFADPATLALTTIPDSPLVTQRLIQPPIWLWNGYTVLAANESDSSTTAPNGHLGRLAAYDPGSRRWHVLRTAPGRPALATAPIFAEQQLLVLTLDGGLLSLGKRP